MKEKLLQIGFTETFNNIVYKYMNTDNCIDMKNVYISYDGAFYLVYELYENDSFDELFIELPNIKTIEDVQTLIKLIEK